MVMDYNLSAPIQSAAGVCEINQLNMLNGLQKLPQQVVTFMLISLVALLIYIYVVPRLQESMREVVGHGLVTFAAGLMVFGIIIQSALTWTITYNTWQTITLVASVAVALEIIIVCIKQSDKIKSFFEAHP